LDSQGERSHGDGDRDASQATTTTVDGFVESARAPTRAAREPSIGGEAQMMTAVDGARWHRVAD